MSHMKREFEDDHPEIFGALRCLVCGVEATPELKGRRVSDEGWLCHEHIASDDDAFFASWAEAMVKAEVSLGMLDQMWERIKVKLDDLHKVEQLLAEVFGHRARMVDEDSLTQRSRE